jgi:hypothetical protein
MSDGALRPVDNASAEVLCDVDRRLPRTSSLQHAGYSQLVSALQTHVTSTDDLAAVAALRRRE